MKKVLARLSVFAVCIMLLTGSLLFGTMAKYNSEFNGTGDVPVAKWAFSINGEAEVATKGFSVELTPNTYSNVNDDKVAPGTAGYFEVIVSNVGDVDAEITIKFKPTASTEDAPVPTLKFSSTEPTADENGNYDVSAIGFGEADAEGYYTYTFDDSTTKKLLTKKPTDGEATSETVKIYWCWDFSTNEAADEIDTELGLAGTTAKIVDVQVIATQVKPTKV